MIRLYIITEGVTEEKFVKKTLQSYLVQNNIFCYPINFGGLIKKYKQSYPQVKDLIQRLIKQEHQNKEAHFTTMFDLYALPDDFPNFKSSINSPDPYKRVDELEASFANDLDDRRFMPYIQLHEYEALLFTDISKILPDFPNRAQEVNQLVSLSQNFSSPEVIDDNKESAPSKRIIKLIPEYEGEKVSVGPLAAGRIGIDEMRLKCRHFDNWIKRLIELSRQ
ncbi:MAG: DUF4276 family protein [Calditrichaeota bacterium]|nr:DUF4276 family protein [Calditrichota bacterium]